MEQGLQLRKKQRRLPLNFVKFLRTPILQNTSEQLLMLLHESF